MKITFNNVLLTKALEEDLTMAILAPSILSADFSCLAEQISLIEAGGADWLHIDVMDGHFVPNITFGPGILKSLKEKTSLPFDVHLMIENPENYIDEFIKAGADIITVHVETCTHLHRIIEQIKTSGIKAAVALNPATPIEAIKHVACDIDMILVMTVNPGFGGQKFISSMKPKIRQLSAFLNSEGCKKDIEIDGGVTLYNAKELVELGATAIVAGSAIFNNGNISDTTKQFKRILSF